MIRQSSTRIEHGVGRHHSATFKSADDGDAAFKMNQLGRRETDGLRRLTITLSAASLLQSCDFLR